MNKGPLFMTGMISNTMKFLTLTLLLFSLPLFGATVIRLGTEELVNSSELVFEVVVLSSEADTDSNGIIHTFVEFSIEEVIVGSLQPTDTLTLRFTGGSVGNLRLDAGVRIPEINERGIYFVERIAPGLINPLLGWEQGHFLVTRDGLVLAADNRAVQSVVSRSRSATLQISDGVALGINTAPPATDNDENDSAVFTAEGITQPMSVADFKQRIRELRN